jgi:hypothetical protein
MAFRFNSPLCILNGWGKRFPVQSTRADTDLLKRTGGGTIDEIARGFGLACMTVRSTSRRLSAMAR